MSGAGRDARPAGRARRGRWTRGTSVASCAALYLAWLGRNDLIGWQGGIGRAALASLAMASGGLVARRLWLAG